MTLEQKREIITKNKDPVIAAFDAVLDTHYNIINPVLDAKNEIDSSKFKSESEDVVNSAMAFAQNLLNDAKKYERIRLKIKKDEELTIEDIAYVGICLEFCEIRAARQIEDMTKAKALITEMKNDLQSKLDS